MIKRQVKSWPTQVTRRPWTGTSAQIYTATSTKMKNLQHQSSAKWWGEATIQRKFQMVNRVLLIWQNSLKKSSEYEHEIEDLHLTKLKTDCQNGVMSLRRIFFMYSLFWIEAWLCWLEGSMWRRLRKVSRSNPTYPHKQSCMSVWA
jgi:hypothetical protein